MFRQCPSLVGIKQLSKIKDIYTKDNLTYSKKNFEDYQEKEYLGLKIDDSNGQKDYSSENQDSDIFANLSEENRFKIQKCQTTSKNIATIKSYHKSLTSHLNITFSFINMSFMFYECESLLSLPDIPFWNTEYVIDMSYMFGKCSSLDSLPDISEWNTSNVKYMQFMFEGCESLLSLPDISKWKVSNVINMSYIFGDSGFESLPDISRWDTKNVIDMEYMFRNCFSLVSLPDISL